MPVEHRVKQGEDIASIAEKYGFLPDTVWNDSANAELREKRKDPHVLSPDDVVIIPDKVEKEEDCGGENRHRFRKKGARCSLNIILRKHGEERANEPFVLGVDGEFMEGKTGSDGSIHCPIPPGAKKANLTVGEGEDAIEYEIQLGNIDPIDEMSGVRERLNNLGFRCGKNKNDSDESTADALKAFQLSKGLDVTGELDENTRKALEQDHDA